MDAVGKLPAVQRGCLIEGPALVFQQGEIMQGITDKICRAVTAGMDRDDLAATGDLDALDMVNEPGANVAIAIVSSNLPKKGVADFIEVAIKNVMAALRIAPPDDVSRDKRSGSAAFDP